MKKEKSLELSIILPCRNEEKALSKCLSSIKEVIAKNNINAEIIVSDSSTDRSPQIAKKHGVILVKHNKIGYGTAILEGLKVAKGNYILISDSDGTYDFNEIPNFLKYLREGYDFVIGNRFAYSLDKDSMPWLHKYIGNPLLSGILRFFFRTNIKDSHCGMRAISKEALNKLNLKTTGMEFASEMVVKVVQNKLKTKEIPIKYYPRLGESKLNSFKDGWRHLKFMLIYSPLFLFFIPGLIFFLIGIETMAWLYFSSPSILGIKLYYHPMFISSILTILGYQLIIFSFFSKIYSIIHLNEKNEFFERIIKKITLEKSILIGTIIFILGFFIYLYIFIKWIKSGFGSLNEIKNSIVSLTLITLGIQTIFSSFMISILSIKEK
ncbi:MAG: glycosyltransferase [Candidatus Pacearchaeota archaeon]